MAGIMAGKRRVLKGTLGIDSETHVATVVPIGSIVEIPIAAADSVRMIGVLLDEKPMIMFVWDLKSRSEVVADL
jgi:hypothetical protein